MKVLVEEYEGKIKKLIGELETESKKHITKVAELHEHYMGFKSETAELQALVNIYKAEQERALSAEREARKEVSRFTYANYEL